MTQFTENQCLNRHRNNIKSQFGEDGIIDQIFKIIPENEQNHWSCEFGAWDGKHCSNIFNLIKNKGWTGILIEANKKKFSDLQETYRDAKNAVLINEFVNFSGRMNPAYPVDCQGGDSMLSFSHGPPRIPNDTAGISAGFSR